MCDILTHFDRRPDRQEQMIWYNTALVVMKDWKVRRVALRRKFLALGGSDSRFNKLLWHTRTISDSVFELYRTRCGDFVLFVMLWPIYVNLDVSTITMEIKRLEKVVLF